MASISHAHPVFVYTSCVRSKTRRALSRVGAYANIMTMPRNISCDVMNASAGEARAGQGIQEENRTGARRYLHWYCHHYQRKTSPREPVKRIEGELDCAAERRQLQRLRRAKHRETSFFQVGDVHRCLMEFTFAKGLRTDIFNPQNWGAAAPKSACRVKSREKRTPGSFPFPSLFHS